MILKTVTNAGDPIVDGLGRPIAGLPIKFILVDAKGHAADGWDLTSQERIAPGPITVLTDEAGEFSADLWPTTRGDRVLYWKCSVPIEGVQDFKNALDVGADAEAPVSWFEFRFGSAVPTPQQYAAWVQVTGGFATKALLDAAAGAYDDGDCLLVTNDPTPANNGTYRKSGAGWTQASFDRVAAIEPVARRANWRILTKSDTPVDITYTQAGFATVVTWPRLYLFAGGGTPLFRVEPITNFALANETAIYVDITDPLNGNGELPIHTIYKPQDGAANAYLGDGKFILLYAYYGWFGGLAAPSAIHRGTIGLQHLVAGFTLPTANIAAKAITLAKVEDTIANRLERAYTHIGGTLTKRKISGTDMIISTTGLRVIRGRDNATLSVNAITDLTVPANRVVYLDLDEVPVNGFISAQLSADIYGGNGSPAGFLTNDRKIPLFINVNGTWGGGLLNGAYEPAPPIDTDLRLGLVWLKTLGTALTFNPTTRTLAWDMQLIAPVSESMFSFFGGQSRIKIDPTTLVIPNTAYNVVYLDLTVAAPGGTYPTAAVKVGQYYQDPTRYYGAPRHLPLFVYNQTEWYPVAGFPTPTITGGTMTIPSTAMEIVKTATTIKTYIKGSNPGSAKYLQYNLVRTVAAYDAGAVGTAITNLDAWNLQAVNETTRTMPYTYTLGQMVVNGGAWELAIKENGAADFIGSHMHGDEVMTSATLLIDGVQVATDAVGNFAARRLTLIQKTTLYRCNTNTPVANVTRRTEITTDGIEITQDLEWLTAFTSQFGYLSMLPIKRTTDDTDGGGVITNRGMRDPGYAVETLAPSGFAEIATTDAATVNIWGTTSGYSAKVQILEQPAGTPKSFRFANALNYNKLYFDMANGHTTAPGEKWRVRTRYTLDTTN